MKISFPLYLAGVFCVISSAALARSYTFDPYMLGEQRENIDIALFNQGGQLPGTYMVDVEVNGEQVDSRNVTFTLQHNEQGGSFLQPCLSVADLSRYGVNVENYPGVNVKGACAKLSVIPQLTYNFQFNNQLLLLSVPQQSLRKKITGIASKQLWDDGIPAFLLNYSANTTRTEYRIGTGYRAESSYVQLNPGMNVGPWRLRNQTNWQHQTQGGGKWQTVYTYAERGINDMESRLTLGERSTPNNVFDSVPFRGVMLGSDEAMVPYSQRAFSPVIRGIARTSARVDVKQNGYTVYSAMVAAGPFALDNFSTPGSSGGDLEVTVWETDGSPQIFTIPYQTPAISLKEGYLEYNLMTGQYRPAYSGIDTPLLAQATVMYGLPWDVTVYSGLQGAKHFQSGTVGLGISLGEWGAVSVDTIASRGQRQYQSTESGAAWRIRYSKNVVATNTTVSMSSYQYASPHYNTLSGVMDSWRNGVVYDEWWNAQVDERRKSTTSLQLSQSLGEWGYLNLNGNRNEYWGHVGHRDSYGASYGVGFSGASITVGWTQNKQNNNSGAQRTNRQVNLFVSIPLERWSGKEINTTYQMTSASRDGRAQEVGVNGRAVDRQLYWDVRQSHRSGDDSDVSNNSTVRLSWSGGYGQAGVNYNYGSTLRQIGVDVAGGGIIHRDGVTLGQSVGDTIALVKAPGASGVSVGGWPGIKTDFRGYTTVANLVPYQENVISLDPSTFSQNVDVSQTDTKVIPTKGAVSLAKFTTHVGERALMTLKWVDGQPVPFGAWVTVRGAGGAGVVGEGGQVYITGLQKQGEIVAQWSQHQCVASYRLTDELDASGIHLWAGKCH